eukprot:scaffold4358_cov37-Prasinocladus_malaysianus.AAC.1
MNRNPSDDNQASFRFLAFAQITSCCTSITERAEVYTDRLAVLMSLRLTQPPVNLMASTHSTTESHQNEKSRLLLLRLPCLIQTTRFTHVAGRYLAHTIGPADAPLRNLTNIRRTLSHVKHQVLVLERLQKKRGLMLPGNCTMPCNDLRMYGQTFQHTMPHDKKLALYAERTNHLEIVLAISLHSR